MVSDDFSVSDNRTVDILPITLKYTNVKSINVKNSYFKSFCKSFEEGAFMGGIAYQNS